MLIALPSRARGTLFTRVDALEHCGIGKFTASRINALLTYPNHGILRRPRALVAAWDLRSAHNHPENLRFIFASGANKIVSLVAESSSRLPPVSKLNDDEAVCSTSSKSQPSISHRCIRLPTRPLAQLLPLRGNVRRNRCFKRAQ